MVPSKSFAKSNSLIRKENVFVSKKWFYPDNPSSRDVLKEARSREIRTNLLDKSARYAKKTRSFFACTLVQEFKMDEWGTENQRSRDEVARLTDDRNNRTVYES
jgi:hypothetical protein